MPESVETDKASSQQNDSFAKSIRHLSLPRFQRHDSSGVESAIDDEHAPENSLKKQAKNATGGTTEKAKKKARALIDREVSPTNVNGGDENSEKEDATANTKMNGNSNNNSNSSNYNNKPDGSTTSTTPRKNGNVKDGHASPSSSNSHLRESENVDDIYQTVSHHSSTMDPRAIPPSPSKRKSNIGQEPPKEIPNSWSFFNRNNDKAESRYETEEEEEKNKMPSYHGDERHAREIDMNNARRDPDELDVEDLTPADQQGLEARTPFAHSQSFSNFLPSMFSGKSNTQQDSVGGLNIPVANPENDFHTTDELTRQQNLFKKFSIFNRRRNRDQTGRKQSIIAPEPGEEVKEDPDKPTGERAQKLIGSLAMGAPAINLLASCLLEDEHGISRAPLVLTLIGLRIEDISNGINTRIRKFKIYLEYGVGPQRLKWSVDKTAKDLLYLHSKFKFERWRNEVVRNKNSELPKCPIPPLRNTDANLMTRRRRSLPNNPEIHRNSIDEELYIRENPHTDRTHEESIRNRNANNNNGITVQNLDAWNILHRNSINTNNREHNDEDNDDNSMYSVHSFRNHLARLKSQLSLSSISSHDQTPEQIRTKIKKNQDYIRDVEKYLNSMIELCALKPQSNRLFQFFEISPISSLLSYETGFQGKQGIIHISGSTKSQGWRVGHFRANDLKGMIDRRSEKWFLVRHSYVMYVSDINSTLPLEVFIVDNKFRIGYKRDIDSVKDDDESDYDDSSLIQKKIADIETKQAAHNVFNHLKITLENGERKLQIMPKSHKEQKLWIKSLTEMKASTQWSDSHRFGSFAPVRENCFAQWFVDGRDYFWAVSSALEMAKDVIFIHDWWLSPELYLRRPANGNQQWRIDRILQRKAKQGVKIFVIVYRNVGSTVAIDSLYTKHSILSLNEDNIHVIRSPNQLLQNTYFWAHHEKLCIIDQTVAFVGGIDLCYGRYDTPDHVLVDDSDINFNTLGHDDRPTTEEFIRFQTFPGKDYSNPRVKDFSNLDKPYESMYDRNIVPRMPWHDVHMVTSGKVARDLARHFVQRWNYLLRQKRPSRFTPLLTPPPDMTDEEAKKLGLDGTCEVQLLRSAGNWSLGLKEHEQSIQNAYLKLIETSEHFVYIENQFFVTSCFIDGTEIENRIGDALVDRIIRAKHEKTNWKAVIIIPLMPGFESQVDEPDGSSVRVIMQCQYMSISRGRSSIFAKLKKAGIEPDDYIQFFSLRKWGRIGPDRTLVTEQLYIHAKTMVVDDRAAIIGSANINERSMRGIRDSEVCAIVRDKETVRTSMGGEPYLAGRFAHTLRMRLMREHLGVNVDILDIVERRFRRFEDFARTNEGIQAATNIFRNQENIVLSAMVEVASRDILDETGGTFRWRNFQRKKSSDGSSETAPINVPCDEGDEEEDKPTPLALPISFNNRTGIHEANKGIRDKKKHSFDTRVQNSEGHKKDVFGEGLDKYKSKLAKRARLNSTRFLKDLATKAMQENPTDIFLPDIENVREFLEADDYDMVDQMDEQSEIIISERNRERWQLLKKLSYLQRVAAKEKRQSEDESKKRVDAGLSPSINRSASPIAKGSPVPAEVKVPTTSEDLPHNGDMNGSTLDNASVPSLGEKRPEIIGDANAEIPIISLNEQEAQDVIQSINPKRDSPFTKFVDPYGFEDPLDDEFYEDIWYDTARRNTEIYRMVFHTQPDDLVLNWNDYKQFSKLQRAFFVSQQQEAKYRKQNRGRANSSEEIEESESDEESEGFQYRPTMPHRPSRATINVKKFDQVGLLGIAPPTLRENDEETPTKAQAANKKSLRRRLNRNTITEDAEGEVAGAVSPNDTHVEDPNDPRFSDNVDPLSLDVFDEDEGEEGEEEEDVEDNDDGDEAEAEKGHNRIQNEETADQNTRNFHQNHSSKLNNKDSMQTMFQNGDTHSHDGPSNSLPKDSEHVHRTKARRKRKRAGTFSTRRRAHLGERIFDRDSAERILQEVQGNLVFFPADWLSRELEGGNWFYNTDRLPPIDIYD
ncbi:phospholipase D [Scheffersomyces xylosifermentans]|uniref:phospholipase D n=1 Tax=Scheffersomyces xylosifermentans TaxID=1304137 RepID=UPI00315C7B8A